MLTNYFSLPHHSISSPLISQRVAAILRDLRRNLLRWEQRVSDILQRRNEDCSIHKLSHYALETILTPKLYIKRVIPCSPVQCPEGVDSQSSALPEVLKTICCLGYSVLDAGLSFGRRGLVYI